MGCQINKKDKIKVISNISKSNCSTGAWTRNSCFSTDPLTLKNPYHQQSNQYKDLISKMLWVKIIDFLSYKDLKEVGKINRSFNRLVKTNNVLVKFFKKQNSIKKNINLMSFGSFSQLQRNDTCENLTQSVSNV